MLPQLLLLFLLAACALPSAQAGLQCPDLAARGVCSVAEPGFEYFNGCSQVNCRGYGTYVEQLKWCSRPSSAEQRRECRTQAVGVFQKLGPFICSNLQPGTVCRTRGRGFRFFDGCNSVSCEADGQFTSQMRMCPSGDPEGAYCRFMEFQLEEVGGDRRRRNGHRR